MEQAFTRHCEVFESYLRPCDALLLIKALQRFPVKTAVHDILPKSLWLEENKARDQSKSCVADFRDMYYIQKHALLMLR